MAGRTTVPILCIAAIVVTVGSKIPALCVCGNNGGSYGFADINKYLNDGGDIWYGICRECEQAHSRRAEAESKLQALQADYAALAGEHDTALARNHSLQNHLRSAKHSLKEVLAVSQVHTCYSGQFSAYLCQSFLLFHSRKAGMQGRCAQLVVEPV